MLISRDQAERGAPRSHLDVGQVRLVWRAAHVQQVAHDACRGRLQHEAEVR